MTRRIQLSKLEILELALEGAQSRRGQLDRVDDETWRQADNTVAEIIRRIRLTHFHLDRQARLRT